MKKILIIMIIAAVIIFGIFIIKNRKMDGSDYRNIASVLSVEYSKSGDEYGRSTYIQYKDGCITYRYNGGTVEESVEKTCEIDEDFEQSLESIITEYNVRDWENLEKSDIEILDGSTTSFKIEFTDHTIIQLGDSYQMPENGWKAVSEIYNLLETYINNE